MVLAAMTYYPIKPGTDSERIGQIVMRVDNQDIYEIISLPDGSASHQHFGLNGLTEPVINKKLRISVKAMWRDYSPVREG